MKQKKTNYFLIFLKWLLFAVIAAGMGVLIQKTAQENQQAIEAANPPAAVVETPEITPEPEVTQAPAESDLLSEDMIYAFSQGPVAWNEQLPYSGEWCKEVLDGNLFSVFGCGLCAMANVYSTLSPYECSPVDMFHFAKENTGYSPVRGYGAIDWDFMERALNKAGIYTCLCNKNPSLEEFVESIQTAQAAVILVASYEDNTYWKDTSGHYVTIWLYDEESQTVFLSDSGDPEHNRSRIPVKYAYDALSTYSDYQFLLAYSYHEEDNQWKHDGIDIDWVAP